MCAWFAESRKCSVWSGFICLRTNRSDYVGAAGVDDVIKSDQFHVFIALSAKNDEQLEQSRKIYFAR